MKGIQRVYRCTPRALDFCAAELEPKVRAGQFSPNQIQRTICVDIRSQRTIFRYAGTTFKPNNSSWSKRLLKVLRIRKPKPIVI